MHRTVTTQAMTADAPMVRVRPWWIRCDTCGLDFAEGYSDHREAAYLSTVHNRIHHGGHPVAGLTRTP